MDRRARVVVEAPAKINLFLDITGTAENGYHLLDTVMQAVSLGDLVVVGRCGGGGIRVTCSRPGVPEDESNLAHKAAVLFAAQTGLRFAGGLHIHIDKAVPAQAGLGGGSADAAAVLAGMNRLFGCGLPPERLCEMGLVLGADVPFAGRGGCALARGVGEQLTPLVPGLRDCHLVIAKPRAGMDTREAYRLYDALEAPCHAEVGGMEAALAAADPAAVGRRLFNVFEQLPADRGNPDTEAVKTVMRGHGALGAVLSGSGSAVAGLFAESAAAEACRNQLESSVGEAFLAAPVGHGARVIHES